MSVRREIILMDLILGKCSTVPDFSKCYYGSDSSQCPFSKCQWTELWVKNHRSPSRWKLYGFLCDAVWKRNFISCSVYFKYLFNTLKGGELTLNLTKMLLLQWFLMNKRWIVMLTFHPVYVYYILSFFDI